MNEVIKVGNRIRRASWRLDSFVTVTAVGRDKFLGVDERGVEVALTCSAVPVGTAWELAPEPPKRYVVEHRTPKAGERFLANGVCVADRDYAGNWPVIVDEVTP